MTYERELDLTAERLRRLPPVRLEQAAEQVFEVLDRMTDRTVPRLRPSAWGDQVLVIGREVPEEDRAGLVPLLRDLRRQFDLTLG